MFSKRTLLAVWKKYMEYVQRIDDSMTHYKDYLPHYKVLIEILRGEDEDTEDEQEKVVEKTRNSSKKKKAPVESSSFISSSVPLTKIIKSAKTW